MHSEVVLVPSRAACRVCWGRSCFGGMLPSGAGWMGRPEEESRGKARGPRKIGGECLHWFLQVSSCAGLGRGEETVLHSTEVFREVF